MPLMETVTIINKSGKVVSTGKHWVNIWKEAKGAYNEKKAELKAEYRAQLKHRDTQRLIDARDDVRSETSSRRSHRSHKSHRSKVRDDGGAVDKSRPPLTERNLSYATESSVASSRRSRSQAGSRRAKSPMSYKNPYMETSTELAPAQGIHRRHTDMGPTDSALSRGTLPPPYQTTLTTRPPAPLRTRSNPDLHDKDIDMNLAYGKLPPDLLLSPTERLEREQEVKNTMSRLDNLLLEAQCLQASATTIIATLQDNPEAMAAVALTLAELSNLLTKIGPGILPALKASSPAVVALLASPQFLIAGGVAIGVTVVMFGGYKIIKRLQSENPVPQAPKMDEALVYENFEVGSVESWRRGIEGTGMDEVGSVTSVEGEFMTPEAAKQQRQRIRERKREERSEAGSSRTVIRVGSDTTLRQRDIPIRGSSSRVVGSVSGKSEKKSKVAASESGRKSRVAESESGRSRRSKREKEKKEHDDTATEVMTIIDGERKKKGLSDIFKKSEKKSKRNVRESVLSHGPLIEV